MASPLSGPHRGQLLLLCVIVLMVGGMLGLERTVLPIKSEVQLHLSYQKLLFFIFAFGALCRPLHLAHAAGSSLAPPSCPLNAPPQASLKPWPR